MGDEGRMIQPIAEVVMVMGGDSEERRPSQQRKLSTIGRVKDWLAERASNILVNKVIGKD